VRHRRYFRVVKDTAASHRDNPWRSIRERWVCRRRMRRRRMRRRRMKRRRRG
jgi:hypothetical protein